MLAFWLTMDENYMYGISSLEGAVTAGVTPAQPSMLTGTAKVCDGVVGEASMWALLHREGHRLFPDSMFADLFAGTGRRSVPPRVVATVMVCQKLLGLSDREAVEAFTFDARWKYACGGLDFDYPSFAHTVLVDMRARLARSDAPHRIRDVTVEAAAEAGLVGARRVLDSTPLYDAVATMDTVTLIRSALRGLCKAVAGTDLATALGAAISSGDDYATSAKPHIDWDDADARQHLIDSRTRDAMACLAVLDGHQVAPVVAEAAALLARVVGQDLEQGEDGAFRIARRVAPDRVISTVDPDTRHGHKTAAHGFDGYKGHVSVDPESEIIASSTVTLGNVADGAAVAELVAELVDHVPAAASAVPDGAPTSAADEHISSDDEQVPTDAPTPPASNDAPTPTDAPAPTDAPISTEGQVSHGSASSAPDGPDDDAPTATKTVYGDCAYGTGEVIAHLEAHGIDPNVKSQRPQAPDGHFTKDDFRVDLESNEVTCPNGITASIQWGKRQGHARFARACASCPLRDRCTSSASGRGVSVGPHEAELARNRHRQAEPARAADYRATRPKVERKLGHLMRRRHGGRRARVRGRRRVTADFNLLVAAANLARLAVLGLHWGDAHRWAAA